MIPGLELATICGALNSERGASECLYSSVAPIAVCNATELRGALLRVRDDVNSLSRASGHSDANGDSDPKHNSGGGGDDRRRGAMVVFGRHGYGSEREKRRVVHLARGHDTRITGLVFDEDGILSDVQVHDCERRVGETDLEHVEQCGTDSDSDDDDNEQEIFFRPRRWHCKTCGLHKARALAEYYRKWCRDERQNSGSGNTNTNHSRDTGQADDAGRSRRRRKGKLTYPNNTATMAAAHRKKTVCLQRSSEEARRQAMRWMHVAAEHLYNCGGNIATDGTEGGAASAARAIGEMYRRGLGVRKSHEEADRWFARARSTTR